MSHLGKNPRILWIHNMLMSGERVNKEKLAAQYGVTEKSIQRDMEDLKDFFKQVNGTYELQYNRKDKSYYLEISNPLKLPKDELIPLLKTVFESGAIVPERLFEVTDKLVSVAAEIQDKEEIRRFVQQEKDCYQAPSYQNQVGKVLCLAEQAAQNKLWVDVLYYDTETGSKRQEFFAAQAVVLRDRRFFLVGQTKANIENRVVSTIRLDRIESLELLHKQRLYESLDQNDLRQKVVSAGGGEEYKISFVYHGTNLLPIKEKLPHAGFEQTNEGWKVEVCVYGKGIGIWLRGLGKKVSKIAIKKI